MKRYSNPHLAPPHATTSRKPCEVLPRPAFSSTPFIFQTPRPRPIEDEVCTGFQLHPLSDLSLGLALFSAGAARNRQSDRGGRHRHGANNGTGDAGADAGAAPEGGA